MQTRVIWLLLFLVALWFILSSKGRDLLKRAAASVTTP